MAKNLECSLKDASQFIIPQNKGGFKEAKELEKYCINATSVMIPKDRERVARKIRA